MESTRPAILNIEQPTREVLFDEINSNQSNQTLKQKIQLLAQQVLQSAQTYLNQALNAGKSLLMQLRPYAPAIALGLATVTFPKLMVLLLFVLMVQNKEERPEPTIRASAFSC